MKKSILILFALLIPVAGFSQIVFTVKSGGAINSAQFGYSMGSLEPFIGLDVVALSGKVEVNSTVWDADMTGDLYRAYESTMELSGGITMFMPRIGAKYFFGSGALKPYVTASVLKSFASLNLDQKGSYTYWNSDGDVIDDGTVDTTLVDDDTKGLIESLLGFFRFEGGLGVEYTINKYISIGAEYGFGMLLPKGKVTASESEDYDDDGHTDFRSETTTKISATLGMTHAFLVVNFHL